MQDKDLLYENGYGGFNSDGKEYIIKTNEKTTPLPWSHIIANERFGTLLTANGGGYVWYGNSQSNKISSWSNDCLRDAPSEILKLNIGDKQVNVLPYETLEKYQVTYGFGYAKYSYQSEDIEVETIIYVPINKNKKVYKITIKSKEIINDTTLEYTLVPVLGVSREFTKKHIVVEKNDEIAVIKNQYRESYNNSNVCINASQKIEKLKVEDNVFNASYPILFSQSIENEATAEFQLEISCDDSSKNTLQNVEEDMKQIEEFWNSKMKNIKVYTPVESMNIMMNGWLLYQTLSCRMWARTSFYQAGGAYGFRDQLQDSLAILWFAPEITRSQILYHAAHQFEEGDVLHWWHPEKDNGTRTRYTDDLLWLPLVLSKYVEHTGDTNILNEVVPYVKSEVLHENEVERYSLVEKSSCEDTLYNHAKKAIAYGIKLSENGLPKMNGGDWNDGMNQIKGQSIWLGFFMYKVLEEFKKVCIIMQDEEAVSQYEVTQETLKNSLNENGWDGKWFRRAFFENGEPVGSGKNEECKIDGISQSWAVISGAVEEEKCSQAMESLDSYLVDRENMLIKLLTPPFDKTALNPGYIREYIPGVRENGGQYTHGACCCGQFYRTRK